MGKHCFKDFNFFQSENISKFEFPKTWIKLKGVQEWMRRATSIPLNAFPRQNKEVVLLPDSGTNVPRGFVPQCLKTSYFNFRPYKLKMAPKLITLLFWIGVCGWQHLLETQLCFLIKEPSLLDEKRVWFKGSCNTVKITKSFSSTNILPGRKRLPVGTELPSHLYWVSTVHFILFLIFWVVPVTFQLKTHLTNCFLLFYSALTKQSSFKANLCLSFCL